MRLSTSLSGVAGEYLVAAELSRRGYVASLTLRNARGIDILASNAAASKSVGIQVKTNQDSRLGWLLNKKAEDYSEDNLFYVFVNLNGGGQPDFYVVPSEIVSKAIRESHKWWLRTPGRRGQQRKDSPMRMFGDRALQPILKRLEKGGRPTTVAGYHNRWDLLGLGDAAA
jgi:hypothetical protein